MRLDDSPTENDLLSIDWDIAIILDAMRYDFFKELYNHFFEGKLKGVESKGSCTPEWFRKTFTSYYSDIIYISANPYINSLPIRAYSYKAIEHFPEVIDVWLYGWDSLLGTVVPQEVNRIAKKIIDLEASANKRIIVHYLQPHAPYLTPEGYALGFPNPLPDKQMFLMGIDAREGKIKQKLKRLLVIASGLLVRTGIPNGYIWRLVELLGMSPISPLDATRRKVGIEGLKRAYLYNTLIVLEAVAKLVKDLDMRVVITADHGEFLGENNMFSHPCNHGNPILKHVPLFQLKRVKKADLGI